MSDGIQVEQPQHAPPIAGRSHDLALWTGILAGPSLMLAHLQWSYGLVPRECLAHSRLAIHIGSVVCLLLTAAAGAMSWVIFSRHRADASGDSYEAAAAREKFMAMVGILSSALFILVIVAQAIPSFMIDPCWD